MEVQQRAQERLRRSQLTERLKAMAIAKVATINLQERRYCEACESVLCGACSHCHSLNLAMEEPLCLVNTPSMGQGCETWWHAYSAVLLEQTS